MIRTHYNLLMPLFVQFDLLSVAGYI